MKPFTVAVCQMDSKDDKAENVERALSFVDEAAASGADLVTFPEMFTFIGANEAAEANAEPIPGPVTDRLADRADDHGIHVHAGSMYEDAETDGKVHNTTVVIDDGGEIQATYRKIHLFDVTIGDEVVTEESATVEAGESVVTVDTDLATLGLTICYDLRFPELYASLSRRGAEVIFVPAAFTLFTGKDHWEPLLRARAIENQAYVVAAGQIGDKPDSVPKYGKSMVIDPWGSVIARASDQPGMTTADLDPEYFAEIRRELPSLKHKRHDLYDLPVPEGPMKH